MNEYLMNKEAHQKLDRLWQEARDARQLPGKPLRKQLADLLRNYARLLDRNEDQKGVLA